MNDLMPYEPLPRFRFHWRDGSLCEGQGENAADAMLRMGYSEGAVPHLDYWELREPTPGIPAVEGLIR